MMCFFNLPPPPSPQWVKVAPGDRETFRKYRSGSLDPFLKGAAPLCEPVRRGPASPDQKVNIKVKELTSTMIDMTKAKGRMFEQ